MSRARRPFPKGNICTFQTNCVRKMEAKGKGEQGELSSDEPNVQSKRKRRLRCSARTCSISNTSSSETVSNKPRRVASPHLTCVKRLLQPGVPCSHYCSGLTAAEMGKVLVEVLVNDKGGAAVQDERDTTHFSETDRLCTAASACRIRKFQIQRAPQTSDGLPQVAHQPPRQRCGT